MVLSLRETPQSFKGLYLDKYLYKICSQGVYRHLLVELSSIVMVLSTIKSISSRKQDYKVKPGSVTQISRGKFCFSSKTNMILMMVFIDELLGNKDDEVILAGLKYDVKPCIQSIRNLDKNVKECFYRVENVYIKELMFYMKITFQLNHKNSN